MPLLKLLVVDLDLTLVDTKDASNSPSPERKQIEIVADATYKFDIYLRPYVSDFLRACRSKSDLVIVLWSAGLHDYVYEVLDKVVLPAVPDFYFDGIMTQAHGSFKDIAWLAGIFGADDRYLLVDDNAMHYSDWFDKEHLYAIRPFYASDTVASDDDDLLFVLDHEFFD